MCMIIIGFLKVFCLISLKKSKVLKIFWVIIINWWIRMRKVKLYDWFGFFIFFSLLCKTLCRIEDRERSRMICTTLSRDNRRPLSWNQCNCNKFRSSLLSTRSIYLASNYFPLHCKGPCILIEQSSSSSAFELNWHSSMSLKILVNHR